MPLLQESWAMKRTMAREVLINAGLMKKPFKIREAKASIASNSTAIAENI